MILQDVEFQLAAIRGLGLQRASAYAAMDSAGDSASLSTPQATYFKGSAVRVSATYRRRAATVRASAQYHPRYQETAV
jgi:hypothetical protein